MRKHLREKLKATLRQTRRRLYPRADESLQLAVGSLHASLLADRPIRKLQDAEFRVFSQWGEDGIIQYLIGKLRCQNQTFIEFGVQDYREANTRFLMMNNHWSGLIIDGDKYHRQFLKKQRLDWKYDIKATTAFITAENINALILAGGLSGEIGILSVDIDGVDYWVLQAIEVVQPQIVIVEYNSFFGDQHAISVPYRPDFVRRKAHYSDLFWGASLGAFYRLLVPRGYLFVGCNSAGNNGFFVKRDAVIGELPEVTLNDGYVRAKFWECKSRTGEIDLSRNLKGLLTELADFDVVDVVSGERVPLGSLQL